MSCLITERLEAIPNGQPLPAQRASDDVKLCTCQIRTCAGEGEHVFASGRLVVWRNKESALANVKESRVCQFLENLYITSDWCEKPIFFCCNSLQHTETLTFGIYFDSCLVFFD